MNRVKMTFPNLNNRVRYFYIEPLAALYAGSVTADRWAAGTMVDDVPWNLGEYAEHAIENPDNRQFTNWLHGVSYLEVLLRFRVSYDGDFLDEAVLEEITEYNKRSFMLTVEQEPEEGWPDEKSV